MLSIENVLAYQGNGVEMV